MTRSRFDQEVDVAIRKREREKAKRNSTCTECGGSYSPSLRRIWHEFTCSQNPTFRKRRYPKLDQERHAAGLSSPICRHGFGDDWTRCPACTEEADYDHGVYVGDEF